MENIERIQEELDREEGTIKVTITTLQGTNSLFVPEGSTVERVKELNETPNLKFVDSKTTKTLRNNDVITADTVVFATAPKKNGQ